MLGMAFVRKLLKSYLRMKKVKKKVIISPVCNLSPPVRILNVLKGLLNICGICTVNNANLSQTIPNYYEVLFFIDYLEPNMIVTNPVYISRRARLAIRREN